jgi:hypothetical protein
LNSIKSVEALFKSTLNEVGEESRDNRPHTFRRGKERRRMREAAKTAPSSDYQNSLSHREREGAAKRRKGEGDPLTHITLILPLGCAKRAPPSPSGRRVLGSTE